MLRTSIWDGCLLFLCLFSSSSLLPVVFRPFSSLIPPLIQCLSSLLPGPFFRGWESVSEIESESESESESRMKDESASERVSEWERE